MTKEQRREYDRAYYAQYRDKINEHRKASRTKLTDEQRARMSAYQRLRVKAAKTPHSLSRYWLPVTEILPKLVPQEPMDGVAWSRSADVLVLTDDGRIAMGHYEHDDLGPLNAWVLDDDSLLTTDCVTHWMPLPDKPEADE